MKNLNIIPALISLAGFLVDTINFKKEKIYVSDVDHSIIHQESATVLIRGKDIKLNPVEITFIELLRKHLRPKDFIDYQIGKREFKLSKKRFGQLVVDCKKLIV